MRRGRPRGRLSECRDCADPIVFAQLDTGSRIPLNPLPNGAGNVAVRTIGGALHGYVIADAKPYRPDHDRMMPHAATCKSRPASPTCQCVAYTLRTDYGTGIEHDVDRSDCPIHVQDDERDDPLF